MVSGREKPPFRSRSDSTSPRLRFDANSRSWSRAQSARARFSSNVDSPSVSHRGTRWFDICRATTWAISCQSVDSQLNSPGLRARGESRVTTLPKQAPSAPIMPGRPRVRTAKWSCWGNTSIRIGTSGSMP